MDPASFIDVTILQFNLFFKIIEQKSIISGLQKIIGVKRLTILLLDSDLITNELKDVTKFLKSNPYSAFKGADDPATQAVSSTSIIYNDRVKKNIIGNIK